MSAVLVTGGTGTLGRPTVERLRAGGREVRVLSRSSAAGHSVGDLRSEKGVREAMSGADVVLHLATAGGPGAASGVPHTILEVRSAP